MRVATTTDFLPKRNELVVTDGTLDKQDAGGRLRRLDELATVENESGDIFHHPPKAEELPERLERMCAFANVEEPGFFIRPAVRAMLLHFWLAYDHPFVNGRSWSQFNHRQVEVLNHAMRHPGTIYTIEGHRRSHNTAYDTARRDLLELTQNNLLLKSKRGKAMIFTAAPDLAVKLKR